MDCCEFRITWNYALNTTVNSLLKKVLFVPTFSHKFSYKNSSRFFSLSALGGFYSSDDILKHETVRHCTIRT